MRKAAKLSGGPDQQEGQVRGIISQELNPHRGQVMIIRESSGL